MATTKFVNIWQLMSKYTFEIEPDSTMGNMACLICKRLLIDACQSACGCQYCKKCISNYLVGGDKYCPGGKPECNEEMLVLDRDVTRSRTLNNKIYNLKVLCPNDLCRSKVHLNAMQEHLRLCTKQSIACPYLKMGCDEKSSPRTSILNHLQSETLSHTNLLIEWIDNLKNEMNGLKANFNMATSEIGTLKEQLQLTNGEIGDIKVHMEVMKKESESRIETLERDLAIKEVKIRDINANTEAARCGDSRIEVLEREARSKDADIREIQAQMEYVKEESEQKDERLADLERDSRDKEVQLTEMVQQIINLKKENGAMKEESRNVKAALEVMSRKVREKKSRGDITRSPGLGVLKVEKEKRVKKMERKPRVKVEKMLGRGVDKMEKVLVDMDAGVVLGQMVVVVEGFSGRKEGERMVSEHFYSHRHGYKLQVWVLPRQYGPLLSVCFMLCRGEYDQVLEWPCEVSLHISLLNQVTGAPEHAVTLSHASMHTNTKYLFNRPSLGKDNHPYEVRLISHDQLRASPGLLHDDSVHVRCSVTQ